MLSTQTKVRVKILPSQRIQQRSVIASAEVEIESELGTIKLFDCRFFMHRNGSLLFSLPTHKSIDQTGRVEHRASVQLPKELEKMIVEEAQREWERVTLEPPKRLSRPEISL